MGMNTLNDLLMALSDLDEAAAPIAFDPAELVGELQDKVDDIHRVLSRLDMEADRLRGDAGDIMRAVKAVENNAQRLRDYVKATMESNGFNKLPGQKWRLDLQNGAPSLKFEREPKPDDAIDTPEYVERQVYYVWKTDKIKQDLAEGKALEYAKLVPTRYPRFYVKKGT